MDKWFDLSPIVQAFIIATVEQQEDIEREQFALEEFVATQGRR